MLAVLEAFSPQRHTLTARGLSDATGIPLPSMYRYLALLRDTGLIAGDDRGSYHLTGKLISLARAAEAAQAADGAKEAGAVTAGTSETHGIDESESV